MRGTRVVVLARKGRASLDDDHARMLEQRASVTYVAGDAPPDTARAVELLGGAEVLAATNLCLPPLEPTLLDAAPHLGHVVLHATGYDHIDVYELAGRGISLTTLPEYATVAVAEHCVGLLLSLTTRIHLAHARGQGAVAGDVSLRGVENRGRTLGIVGLGRIGSEVASMARGIGMEVVAHDIDSLAVARGTAASVGMVTLEALLRTSDAVAVCASHSPTAPRRSSVATSWPSSGRAPSS